jgi:hypothetical protein
VAFLNCGSALQPILPKSQCWCVDDTKSKFVLKIRQPQYWRIELPHDNEDDLRRLEELKCVLSTVLLYEKTACPFARSFTVPLPEPPEVPIKKKPWTPKNQPILHASKSPFVEVPPKSESDVDEYYSAISDEGDENEESSSCEAQHHDAIDDQDITPTNPFPTAYFPLGQSKEKTETLPGALQTGRSVTAPPQLTLIASPPSKTASRQSAFVRHRDLVAPMDDTDPFQSPMKVWDSPVSPLPPSPPQSNPGSPDQIVLPKRSKHSRQVSPIDLTPEMQRTRELSGMPSSSQSVRALSKFEESCIKSSNNTQCERPTTPEQSLRRRSKTTSNSRRRSLSPLPPAANIFSPTRRKPRHLQTRHHMPIAIIQKTCEILLSPPSHLLQLMVNIASRIAAGEWRGVMFGFGEGGEKIVGQWDYSDGDYADAWGEDDYGMSLAKTAHARQQKNTMPGNYNGSWESD